MKRYSLYAEICERAEKLGVNVNRMTLMMDLESADKKFDLLLEDMLNADDFNFMHDIVGIENNIRRDAFPATDFGFFIPRFANRIG